MKTPANNLKLQTGIGISQLFNALVRRYILQFIALVTMTRSRTIYRYAFRRKFDVKLRIAIAAQTGAQNERTIAVMHPRRQ